MASANYAVGTGLAVYSQLICMPAGRPHSCLRSSVIKKKNGGEQLRSFLHIFSDISLTHSVRIWRWSVEFVFALYRFLWCHYMSMSVEKVLYLHPEHLQTTTALKIIINETGGSILRHTTGWIYPGRFREIKQAWMTNSIGSVKALLSGDISTLNKEK